MGQRFDPAELVISGEPFPIAEHVESFAPTGILSFSASDEGTLAYGTGAGVSSTEVQLQWLDRDGKVTASVGRPGNYRGIDVTPDEKQIVAHRHDGNGGDIWRIDSANNVHSRLTFDESQENSSPIVSPDGKRVAFASLRSGKWGIYVKSITGSGNEELFLASDKQVLPVSWTRDGETLVYWILDVATGGDLWRLPVTGDRKPSPLVNSKFNEDHGEVSPDGKWVAFQSFETGRSEVHVRPFPSGDGKWSVSDGGGFFPKWRLDGRELFYMDRGTGGKLVAAQVEPSSSEFRHGRPKPLFQTDYFNYGHAPYVPFAVSADGRRFLIPRPVSNAAADPALTPIVVVTNWLEELKQRGHGR